LSWQPHWQWRRHRLVDKVAHPVDREQEPPEREAAVEVPAAVVAVVDAAEARKARHLP
jgi:hypothetical protein